MPLDKYPERHGRAVSSPSTHSESYGRFASKSFHLDTFPIRIWIKQFSSPAMLPQSSGAGHQAGQANLTDIRLVHFYVCRMDVLGCRRARQSGKAVKLERGPFGTLLCVPNGRSGMPQSKAGKAGKLERGPFGTFLCVPNGRYGMSPQSRQACQTSV